MSDPFAGLDDMVSAVVGQVFGVPVIITPRLPGSQYVDPGADPERVAITVTAVYSSGPAIENIGGQGVSGASGGTTKISGQSLVFWLSPATIRTIPYAIRKGDELAFADSPVRVFQVSNLRTTNTGDLELVVTRWE